MLVGRLCVLGMSLIACLLALNPGNTVLALVSYAWGGLGAAFGPLVLFALFSRTTSWRSALAGMVTGALVLILWKHLGLGPAMYEIVPGFLSNCLAMMTVNRFFPEKRKKVLDEFDRIDRQARGQS